MELQEVTNANDVTVEMRVYGVSGRGGAGGRLVVSDWNYSESGDSSLRSGSGNHLPVGITHGSKTFEFDVTLEGEDAKLMKSISLGQTGDGETPVDAQVTLRGLGTEWVIDHFFPMNVEWSGSDGDVVEYNANGPCSKARVKDA